MLLQLYVQTCRTAESSSSDEVSMIVDSISIIRDLTSTTNVGKQDQISTFMIQALGQQRDATYLKA